MNLCFSFWDRFFKYKFKFSWLSNYRHGGQFQTYTWPSSLLYSSNLKGQANNVVVLATSKYVHFNYIERLKKWQVAKSVDSVEPCQAEPDTATYYLLQVPRYQCPQGSCAHWYLRMARSPFEEGRKESLSYIVAMISFCHRSSLGPSLFFSEFQV